MKKFFYFLLAVLSIQSVQAGDKILNGGNVIVCGNNVELLDYYEARLTGKELQFNQEALTYTEKLNQLFDRWRKVAPERMGLYSQWLNEFELDAGIYSGVKIPDIQDTGSVAIPSGCIMTPAAFQRRDEDIFPGEKRYVINKDLWDLMNQEQKAGLVLHELIYREAIKNAHATSLQTRYFNGFLSTEVTPDMDKYFATAYRMPMTWAEYGGMNIDIGKVSCSNWPLGNSGCRFDYESKYSSDYLNLRVLSVVGDIRTKEMSVDCYDGPCKIYEYSSYEYVRERDSLNLSSFISKIKNLYLKDKMNITDIQSDGLLRISNKNLYSDRGNDFLIGVNPETSWYQALSGERIEHFKGYGKFEKQIIFQTIDNKIWFYSDEKNTFTELYMTIKFQGKEMSCNLNSLNRDSEGHYIYNCPALPKQFSCGVVVRDNSDSVTYKNIVVNLVNNSIRLVWSHSGTYRYLHVRIPKGQTLFFTKKRFGKLEAYPAPYEFWESVEWDERGENCKI